MRVLKKKLLVALFACGFAMPVWADDGEIDEVLEVFDDVPKAMHKYVADMKDVVLTCGEDADALQSDMSREQIESVLSSISKSLKDLTLGIARYEDAPKDVRQVGHKQKNRVVIYSESEDVFFILADRATTIGSESEALRMTFIEVFTIATSNLEIETNRRRAIASSLCEEAEQPRSRKSVRYIHGSQPPPRQQGSSSQSHSGHNHPMAAPQRYVPPVVVHVPQQTYTPPAPPPTYQAQTSVELERLKSELERTKLQGEIENTRLRQQLSATKDDRRNLEGDFQAWISAHQKEDRDLGKDFDFRRLKSSGRYQPEYPAYLAPGGWGTTNPYGAGGATKYFCNVCGEWLDLPQRFQSLKPR
jgi:hypothetical protein